MGKKRQMHKRAELQPQSSEPNNPQPIFWPSDASTVKSPSLSAPVATPLLLEGAKALGHDFSQIQVFPDLQLPIQPKLTVGTAGDAFEQEAERVAATLTSRVNDSADPQQSSNHEDRLVQPVGQLPTAPDGVSAMPGLETALQQERTGGAPLDSQVRNPMEQAFGASFADVRVHADAQADLFNRALGARAFTTAPDLFFRQGEYRPDTTEGQELIAHELTHVVQQAGGEARAAPLQRKSIKEQLNEAMDGWGTDEAAIMSLAANATEVQKQEILNDAGLVKRLAGELNQAEMIQMLANLNAPLKQRLNVAMDGWGTDEATIMSLTAGATDAQKHEILNDAGLVKRLAGELNQAEMLQMLANLNAPLKQRLNVAMDGWGTDEAAIHSIIAGATDVEKRDVASDTVLMKRLLDELGGSDLDQVVRNLGLLGTAQASQTEPETGNAYQSLVVLFPNGVNISRDMQFVEQGTFAPGALDILKGRIISQVSSFLSGKFKLKIASASGTPENGDGVYPISVAVVDNSSADYPMRLHGGTHGRSAVGEDGGDIYALGMADEAAIPDITLAHECAHVILGASDEYADAERPGRTIHSDHSLMGNFYNEGIAAAEIKARHFEMLVTQVSKWFPSRTISIVK